MAKRARTRTLCGISAFPLDVFLMRTVKLQWLPLWNPKGRKMEARVATLSLVKAGRLTLPTGRLMVLDPLTDDQAKPIPGRLPAGRYDVFRSEARIEGDSKTCTAALVLRVSSVKPTRFVAARSFSVDSATAAFVDASGHRALFDLQDPEDPQAGYEKIWASTDGRLVLDKRTRANVVVCTPARGDGSYRVWRGYDADARVCTIVAELGLVMPIEEVLRHPLETLKDLVLGDERVRSEGVSP